ncbi:SIMPL domain-containing protein [Aquirufa beregesia]|nr:SIMPL domain-containing protein [Aquirufa beregesia]
MSQTKNFIDQAHIETSAKVDTLVSPDRIYLNITISEKDTKGKISLEELENNMNNKLKSLGIATDKQLILKDLSSNFQKYFLKQQDIQKSKNYTLLVYSALMAGKVMVGLEQINISNISLEKTEYANMESLLLTLKSRAIKKAKMQALAMTKPLNQSLGNALYISDNSNFMSPYNNRMLGIQMKASKNSLENDSLTPIDIEFEKIPVETEVRVVFKLD